MIDLTQLTLDEGELIWQCAAGRRLLITFRAVEGPAAVKSGQTDGRELRRGAVRFRRRGLDSRVSFLIDRFRSPA